MAAARSARRRAGRRRPSPSSSRADEAAAIDTGRGRPDRGLVDATPRVVASGSSDPCRRAAESEPRSRPITRGDQRGAPAVCVYEAFAFITSGATPAAIARRYGTSPRASTAGPADREPPRRRSTPLRAEAGKVLEGRRDASVEQARAKPWRPSPLAPRVENPRRCAAMNAPGTPGTRDVARSTSTPRRSSAVAVSRPRRRIAPSQPSELLGGDSRRRPRSADEASLLVGRDQDPPSPARAHHEGSRQRAPLGRCPHIRTHGGSRLRPGPCGSARGARRSGWCRFMPTTSRHRRARRAEPEPLRRRPRPARQHETTSRGLRGDATGSVVLA